MNELDIFAAALELQSPEERARHLDEACGADGGLRRRIEELLGAHASAGSFMGVPAQDRVPEATGAESTNEVIGTIIGPYKLVQQIGEGGMGTVWMAQQTEPVRRLVAVKVIKPGMDSRSVIARFEAERQALALMDHPNIARVLDGGTTSAGRPYFVMDLVKGVPITRYCDEHHLTPRQRLELFVPVCGAVQHAHQKGIIHRDLKPSNVLVALYDGKPVPKVIDFGVAKAAGQPLTDKTLVTGFGDIVGTLEYMSPEQAELNNFDIDTRSDIYALGVVLYELLTGTVPHSRKDLKSVGFAEMLRVIKEVEPPKPSTRLSGSGSLPSIAASRHTEPKRLTALLRNDLDWIVMKALEKDRSLRYETANGFAMDILRYLADEPVLAGPPSAGYRLRKFVKRNRPQVIAAGLVLAALLLGIAGTAFGLVRAERRRVEAETARAAEAAQRGIADAENRKAQDAEDKTLVSYRASTNDAIEQLIGSKSKLGPQERAYLTATLARWQEFAQREGDDERSRAIRAEGHFRVGSLWKKLGGVVEAQQELETARDLYKRLADAFPAVPQYQHALANAHNDLAILLGELGQSDTARKAGETARDLLQKLVDAFPDLPRYQRDLANNHDNMGAQLARLGRHGEALKEFETARDLHQKLVSGFPGVRQHRQELAAVQCNLGSALKELGKSDEARKKYQTAADLQNYLVEAHPTVAEYQVELANTHNNLGALLIAQRRFGEARREFEAARDGYKRLVDVFPAVLKYRVGFGLTCNNLGKLICETGHPADGLLLLDLAIRTLTPVYEQEPRDVDTKYALCLSHRNRALAFRQLTKHSDAVKDWDRAIDLASESDVPYCRMRRAAARAKAGQVAEAVAEVVDLTKSSNWDADYWYNFACVYGVASGQIAAKKQEYADRAMESLHKAEKSASMNAAHIKKDTDLDALRGREDFKKLVAELEKKNPPKEKP